MSACIICGKGVNLDRLDTRMEVIGWVKKRAQGGANAVRDQRPTGRVMCADCGHLRDLGVLPNQQGLGL